MNRLFNTLRALVERPRSAAPPALPGFENRLEVLYRYSQQAAEYEDDLNAHLSNAQANMDRLQGMVEAALDAGQDRNALEYLRLAARLRPQRDLLTAELNAFHAVAAELIRRVNTLMDNIGEARAFAQDEALSPAATQMLDLTLTRLTRYFVMLERVTNTRRRALPERLAQQLNLVIDDRELDLELARYVLQRRRALNAGRSTYQGDSSS